MTTIINLYGSAGAGKSTTALGLVYKLKLLGYRVEYVSEWIKEKIYAKDLNVVRDQLYIFAKQRRKQFILMDEGLDFVVSDSPLLLSQFYGEKYNTTDALIKSVIFNEYSKFNNLSFFLKRTTPFDPVGRIETEEQSDSDSIKMIEFLNTYNIDYHYIQEHEKTDKIIKLLNLGNK